MLWCAALAPAIGGLLNQNILIGKNTKLKVAYSFREERRGKFTALLPLSHRHLQWGNQRGTQDQRILLMAPCISAPGHAGSGWVGSPVRVNGALRHLGLACYVVWILRGGRRPSVSGQSVCTRTRPVQLWSPIVSLPATFVGSRSRGPFESKSHAAYGCFRSHLRNADKRQGVWTCPIKTPAVHMAGVC